jgi:hypothetical protein
MAVPSTRHLRIGITDALEKAAVIPTEEPILGGSPQEGKPGFGDVGATVTAKTLADERR